MKKDQWKPRCFGHYKDSHKECQQCKVYYDCYKSLMMKFINDPEAPRIVIK